MSCRRRGRRIARRRLQHILRRRDQFRGFFLPRCRKREMNCHLIAVEVGVERRTNERVNLNRFSFDQNRLEGLNSESVQRRRAIEQHFFTFDHFFERIPNFAAILLDQFFGGLHIVREIATNQFADHEGFEQFECHFLSAGPHSDKWSFGPTTMTSDRNNRVRFPSKFWRKRPCFPFNISDSERNLRLSPTEKTAFAERAELCNIVSTASCSIRFSLR